MASRRRQPSDIKCASPKDTLRPRRTEIYATSTPPRWTGRKLWRGLKRLQNWLGLR
ncbi:TPA: hypothetical protein N0F65_011088 [Lagenidium giganteum]|uniref:Uncharacterized protein n=1 Tax=Lagenidium giganteum TaxID=4803 RepID=A0AAV2ZF81_9STRA|nr:TPA: hypothetical protein N0F65_011088 [Lagenidium giganteum]